MIAPAAGGAERRRAEDRRRDLNSRGGRMKGYAVSPRPNDLPRTALLAEDFMDPAQFRDVWSGDSHSPECELAAAVLDAAVIDLQKYRYARGRYRQRMYWQAYQWVASGDRQWPFSFVNVCEVLRLSPEALRARLLSWPYGEAAKAQAA
jgi:hypothetical protein